jgi:2-oxoisovalerate ferredoxin oxidoreductase beta subunit
MYVKALERPKSLFGEFDRKPGDRFTTHYCPGCGHGNLHKYIAEAIDELGIQDRTVLVNPVGCSVFAYYYFDVGNVQVPHGRAPAAATGVKRALPDSIVISYQGDGDLAAIGGNEILHAANRGENITVFFVNNAIYGMTGGQMAPTTPLGQRTSTSPMGRAIGAEGFPLRVSELLATLEGPTYIERVALHDNKSRMRARKAVKKALQNQVEGRGFSLVEVLSPCPTGWGMTPGDACTWIKEHLSETFPLGVIKDLSTERHDWTRHRQRVAVEEIPGILGLLHEREDAPLGSFDAGAVSARYIDPRIKIAGFGGQGVLFLGKLLAEVGMAEGFHVSWLPSYGPEMRGGTANCHVNISRTPVGSPLISDPSVLIALNRPSLEKFQGEVAPGGVIIYDASLIDVAPTRQDVEVIAIPVTEIAYRIGSGKVANMVALGAFTGVTKLLGRGHIARVIKAMTKKEALVDLNLQAVEAGASFVGALREDDNLWAV